MTERKAFLVYKEWREPVGMLSDEQAGRLLKAMLAFWVDNESPAFDDDPALNMISTFIFSQFQRDGAAYAARCEINKVNGAKGGRPKKRTKAEKTERFLEEAEKADEDEDKDKDKDEDKDEGGDEAEAKEVSRRPKRNTLFKPPSVEEVRKYCAERGNGIDPESFVDFYTARGWMIGKNKMRDWKAAVRTWEKNQKGRENGRYYQNEGAIETGERGDYNFDKLFG